MWIVITSKLFGQLLTKPDKRKKEEEKKNLKVSQPLKKEPPENLKNAATMPVKVRKDIFRVILSPQETSQTEI